MDIRGKQISISRLKLPQILFKSRIPNVDKIYYITRIIFQSQQLRLSTLDPFWKLHKD